MERQEADTYVPFELDGRAACRAARALCGRRATPPSAMGKMQPEAFCAVYVPFWRVHGTAEYSYTGQWGEEQDYRDSDGDWQTDTDRYAVDGAAGYDLDDAVLLCASEEYENAFDGMFPYDLSKAQAYASERTRDIRAVPCTVTWNAAWEDAQEQIRTLLCGMIENDLRGEYQTQSAEVHELNISYSDIVPECILLPLWETSFIYDGTTYTVRVNGQTGSVCGDLPPAPRGAGCLAAAAAILSILLVLWQ